VRALVFPGQGSQAVGMGRELDAAFAAAREVFQEVDEALKQNLSKLMFEGPEGDLILTENAQPALMAVSLAAMRVLEAEAGIDLGRDAAYVADVIAAWQTAGQTCVQVFFVRGGRNNGNRAFFPSHTKAEEAPEVLSAFIGQFYDDKPPPPLLLVQMHPDRREHHHVKSLTALVQVDEIRQAVIQPFNSSRGM